MTIAEPEQAEEEVEALKKQLDGLAGAQLEEKFASLAWAHSDDAPPTVRLQAGHSDLFLVHSDICCLDRMRHRLPLGRCRSVTWDGSALVRVSGPQHRIVLVVYRHLLTDCGCDSSGAAVRGGGECAG